MACPNSSTIYYDYDQGTLNTVAYPDGTGTTVTLNFPAERVELAA